MAANDLILNPSVIMSDFESGLRAAIRQHFPRSSLRCCFFHHTQAIWRKAVSLGLETTYRREEEVKDVVRMLMCLAFLPTEEVEEQFDILRATEAVRRSPSLQNLFEYYSRTWLNGPFPLSLWNVNGQILRTNNLVEGWHNKLSREIGRVHPDIFKLIENIQRLSRSAKVTMNMAQNGVPPKPQRRKYRKVNEAIERLTQQHAQGQRTSQEFLRALRHNIMQL